MRGNHIDKILLYFRELLVLEELCEGWQSIHHIVLLILVVVVFDGASLIEGWDINEVPIGLPITPGVFDVVCIDCFISQFDIDEHPHPWFPLDVKFSDISECQVQL